MNTLTIDPEFKSELPGLTDEEYSALEQSILEEGCRDALVVWAGHGILVDGHHRYEICQKHGLSYQTVEREFETRAHALLWMHKNQGARRNITKYVKDLAALRMRALLEELGRANMAAGGGDKKSEEAKSGSSNWKNPIQPVDTWKEAASAYNTSIGAMSRTATVERDAPEPIKQKARSGEITPHRAYKLTQALKGADPELVEAVARLGIDEPDTVDTLKRLKESGGREGSNETYDEVLRSGYIQPGEESEAVHITDSPSRIRQALETKAKAHRQLARIERQEARRELAKSLPPTVYSVIYADPPWEYSNTGVHGAASHHYDTMPTADICALLDTTGLQVADNAVLFMWVTNPTLEDAWKVIEAWGFQYKTNMVWVKTELQKPGSGFYVRGRHELLFICTRGSFLPLVDVAPPIGSVVTAPVQEHSRKPDEFYSIIERLYPDCNRIELFARATRDGWDAWGDEANGRQYESR